MAKANYLLQIPADYQPLPVPVPPMLARAIGYKPSDNHEAAFVSFYLGIDDKAYYADGMMSGTGYFQAYSAFVDHPRVREQLINKSELEDKASYERFARRIKFFSDIHPIPDVLLKHLMPKYNLGGCDLPNEYRLVLALRADPLQMYILPESLAQNLLMRQWWEHPDQPPAPPSEEELRRNTEAFRKLQAALNDPKSEIYRQLHWQLTGEELNTLLDAQLEMVNQITAWLNDQPYRPPRNTISTCYSD